MAEVLAELVARITADATELKKALAEAEKDIQGTGKALGKETKSWQEQFRAVGKLALGMGIAITGAMTLAIKSFAGAGSELHDLSLKTGVSVKALAGLKYAAEQNGASLGTVQMAIRKTASTLQDARDGLEEATRAFTRMGLSLTELEGLNPEEQFMKIAGAIAEIPDPMTRAATAQDLFGRSGMDMLPMLSEGAEGLKKTMAAGVAFSKWTKEGADSADALRDTFHDLKTATSGLTNVIGQALAPVLKDAIASIIKIVSVFADWAEEHPELTKAVGALTLAVGVFIAVMGTLVVMAPKFAAAWVAATGPVGAAALAVTALAAGIAILILTTDNAKERQERFYESLEKTGGGLEGTRRYLDSVGLSFKATGAEITKTKRLLQQVGLAVGDMGMQTSEAFKALANQVGEAFTQFVYGRTEAGRLGLTIGDVTNALQIMGLDAQTITKRLEAMGDKAKDVNAVMAEFGLTAQDVTRLVVDQIEVQKEKAKELTATLKEAATRQYEDKKASLEKQKEAAQETYDKAVANIQRLYGLDRDTSRSLIEAAYDVRDARIRAIDDELAKARDAHRERISELGDNQLELIKFVARQQFTSSRLLAKHDTQIASLETGNRKASGIMGGITGTITGAIIVAINYFTNRS